MWRRRLKPVEASETLRQIALLLETQASPTECIEVLRAEAENRATQRFLEAFATSLEDGKSLASALAGYPEHFYPFLTELAERKEGQAALGS